MRPRLRALVMFGLLLAASGGESVSAATKVKPPARARVPAASSTRARIDAPAANRPVSLAPAPPVLSWPPPPAFKRFGQGEGSLASSGLVGLRARTDPAPLCRTACAQARYQCQSGENGDNCDGNWGRCVLACRDPLRP